MHGSWRYLHELQSNMLPTTTDSAATVNQPTSLSVGLVVKKYWNKLVHLSTVLQQHEVGERRSWAFLPILIRTSMFRMIVNDRIRMERELSGHSSEIVFGSEKRQSNNEPCASCSKLQQSLHDHADSLISLCHTYNLPSSLAPLSMFEGRCGILGRYQSLVGLSVDRYRSSVETSRVSAQWLE